MIYGFVLVLVLERGVDADFAGISILEWRSSGDEFWSRSPASGPDNAFEHEDEHEHEHEGEDDDAVSKTKPARDIFPGGVTLRR